MSDKRQKTQLMLAFITEPTGEAPRTDREGTETPTAEKKSESPASTDRLMERILGRENLSRALKRVRTNKGSPGVDGMRVEDLPEHLRVHWSRIREELLQGTYQPAPVKRVEIPKPGGGTRKLGVPTVLDRFIQQAMHQVLQDAWDPTFSEHSYGFRPNRSAHQAVAAAQEHVAAGNRWVVDLDLEKFFDRVNHDLLMGRVAKRISDKRVLKLIRAYLNAGVMADGLTHPTEMGTPQGGPLSPLLSNLLLDDLDRELERRGHRFVRYADDFQIFVRSERAGHRVKEGITSFVRRRLKLKVNGEKSAVDRPWRRKFLGFRLTSGKAPKRGVAPESRQRFQHAVRRLTRRTRGISIRRMIAELGRYLRGWRAYFGFCETPSVLDRLDGWIRRRLRCAIWKQWRRGRRRFRALRQLGVPEIQAALAARTRVGHWCMSGHPTVHRALSTRLFRALGLPTLAPDR